MFNSIRLSVLPIAVVLALSASGAAFAQAKSVQVGQLTPSFADALNASAENAVAEIRLTPVREAALRETALVLGMQWGMGDASRKIVTEYERLGTRLDGKYLFNAMMMGVGIMPPVISEARNAVSVEDTVLRVANRVWTIDQPARPVIVPPTWRDWLYVGLQPALRPSAPTSASVLPRDEPEKAYYRKQMLMGYEQGQKQVAEIFELNLAQLERTYDGMARFFDLYKQGRVTAPVVVSATSIIDNEDPNQVVVGNTVFRIVQGTKFVTEQSAWKPLGK